VTTPYAITTTLPGGGTVIETIDSLGRVAKSETDPRNANATRIVTRTLYDRERERCLRYRRQDRHGQERRGHAEHVQ